MLVAANIQEFIKQAHMYGSRTKLLIISQEENIEDLGLESLGGKLKSKHGTFVVMVEDVPFRMLAVDTNTTEYGNNPKSHVILK